MSTTYRRTKTSALQSLAAAGNVEAQQELARRGEPTTSPSTDVRQMSKQDLLALVQAWNRGRYPADRARNRERAELAQVALELRFNYAAATAPWRHPKPPRGVSRWTPPSTSKNYGRK